MRLLPWSIFLTRSRMLTKATFTSKPCFNKVKDVDKCDFHLAAIFLTRSRMLANATFTLEPLCLKSKVKGVGKCHFQLGTTFFLKQGQRCWQMPLSPRSHFFFLKKKTRSWVLTHANFTLKPCSNEVKDVDKCHFLFLTRSRMLAHATFTLKPLV